MANWLEQMFTPQRPGPGQMAWRDKDVGEGSGEISQGDIQEMYWKRNPAARGHGQQMTSAVRPNPTGSGETMQTKIQDLMPAGLEPGGMSEDVSITESGPSGSIGASIAESMQPRQTMTPGSSRWSGVSMNDNWNDPYQATNAFNAGGYPSALQDGMSIDGGGQNIPVKKILSTNPLERIRAMRAGHNVDYSGGTNNPDPNSALTKPGAMHLMDFFRGLNPTTPNIPDGGAPITQKESPMSMFQPSNFVNPIKFWMDKMGG